ncbi:class I SAM-dependent methyltransferase [Desulfuribacillus alkaliarsenatis]|uniref:Methyltransferase domain-containing protein n=1 Tax=Desulfuribacillus alkaliarsenatis TaxID=766136 RepID=A0A1E5G100_9FIRM|nr:class I SAM-dependent methyltransferase [Desulfuribacillus alkaliarsenatis]OEF96541.1 hypothetical protein BHF68_07780 [Desulfuribacillus alkaliarsenatis]
MSKFYSEIAKYYDYIFPTGKAQIELIKEEVGSQPKDILDVACGSGGYSEQLDQTGYNVTAIDLDEQMVKSLKAKNPNIDTYVLNMLEIEQLNKTFDLIFCIGNSVVHLNNNDEIKQYLQACKRCLNPRGKVVVQVINYDRVLDQQVKSLPLIKNADAGIIFERYYNYIEDQHKIDFHTILKTEDNELENHVLLHPIKSSEFVQLLQESGFKNIQLYGSFKKDTYKPQESAPLIIVAEID